MRSPVGCILMHLRVSYPSSNAIRKNGNENKKNAISEKKPIVPISNLLLAYKYDAVALARDRRRTSSCVAVGRGLPTIWDSIWPASRHTILTIALRCSRFRREGFGKKYVVFLVDMLMEVRFEFRQTVEHDPVGVAGVIGRDETTG